MSGVSHVAELSFFICAIALLLLPPVARKLGLVDRPGGRKTHKGEVPIVGGIGMLTGVLVAAALGARFGDHGVVLLLIAAGVVAVGALDDRFDLPPKLRLTAEALAATVVVELTGFSVGDLGNLLGLGVISLGPFDELFTIVAIVALVNGFNMLDGLDGLAGGAAFWGFLGLALLSVHLERLTSAIVATAMVGAVGAFLLFNVPIRLNRRLRVFMGDAGSTLLGFVFAGVALTLVQSNRADVPPALLLWMVPIPIFELFTTTFRRLVKGASPMAADDGHFHHVLKSRGLSVGWIFVVYIVVSAISMTIGLIGHEAGLPDDVLFLGFLSYYVLWMATLGGTSRLSLLLLGLLAAMKASADQ
jgi:UDP-GlcNAc:undecaprenyl-phosphate GlcNAc-1-phosphate transferase